MLHHSVKETLKELRQVISSLSDRQYAGPSAALHGTSVGEHVRHIIEIFACLINQYDSGIIWYDRRERNKTIEREKAVALQHLDILSDQLIKSDKPLTLIHELDGLELHLSSNYERELLYNLEHCIHHQALIRLALMQFRNIAVPENFGVAPATMRYRESINQPIS